MTQALNRKIIIGVVVLTAILVGGFVLSTNSKDTKSVTGENPEASMEQKPGITDRDFEGKLKEADFDTEGAADMSGKPGGGQAGDSKKPVLPAAAGTYDDYSQSALFAANARGDKVVLFFHAPWCPFCREADAEFLGNPGKIPAGATLLKTDYDQEKALKQQYGVTYQHTFVQIDASGNLLTKWNGGAAEALRLNIK